MATVIGNNSSEQIVGTDAGDWIRGDGGSDTIDGGSRNDCCLAATTRLEPKCSPDSFASADELALAAPRTHRYFRFQKRETIMQERILTGRIANLVIITVPEFGTRASFRIERSAQCPVFCCVAGDVAREFIAHYCEGDMVAVRGFYEPKPSTAAANTPWAGRFRVRAVRVAEDARLAA